MTLEIWHFPSCASHESAGKRLEDYGLNMICLCVKVPKNGAAMLNSESQLERTYNHVGDEPLGISVSHFIAG